jgi:hypothetical protein
LNHTGILKRKNKTKRLSKPNSSFKAKKILFKGKFGTQNKINTVSSRNKSKSIDKKNKTKGKITQWLKNIFITNGHK